MSSIWLIVGVSKIEVLHTQLTNIVKYLSNVEILSRIMPGFWLPSKVCSKSVKDRECT